MTMKQKQQRGVALLMVLLLLVVMSVLVSQMTQSYRLMWLHVSQLKTFQQVRWSLLGGESLVGAILTRSARDEPEKTTLTQYWAIKGKTFAIDNATLRGEVTDAQACFNINSLSGQQGDDPVRSLSYRSAVFQQLLRNLDIEEFRALQITTALEEWLTSAEPGQKQYASGDNDYLAMTPPYLPANRPMQDISELRAVKGVDAAIYRRLAPYICALPNSWLQVNINTLQPEQAPLLAALFLETLTPDDAQKIIAARPFEGWDSVEAFLALDVLSNRAQGDSDNTLSLDSILSVRSLYFESSLEVNIDNNRAQMKSLFQRQGDNRLVVVRRHFGEAL